MANYNWYVKSKFRLIHFILISFLGALGTSFFLFSVGYIECNYVLAVIFISLAVGFIGFQGSGSLISHLDIASNYAG